MRPRTILAAAALAAILFGTMANKGCSESQLRAAARATAKSAEIARSEIDDSHGAGELSDAEVASIDPILGRLEKTANGIDQRLVGYDQLDAAGKRDLISGIVDEGAAIATDFEALHVKNPRAQARMAKIVRNVRRGNEIFQVVLAALPQRQN